MQAKLIKKKLTFSDVMKKIWSDRVSYLFLLPFAVSFITFTVLPVLTSVFYGFTYNNIFEPLRFIGLDNYIRMFTRDDVFPIALQNTLVFAVIIGPGGYLLSFVVAWLINEISSRLRALYVLIFYSPAIAGSVYSETGLELSRARLAAEMVRALDEMYLDWQRDPRAYLSDYRARCVTVGCPVRVVRGEDVRTGFAEAVDDDFALVVRWEDGTRETVTGGDVSVRGLFGYLD